MFTIKLVIIVNTGNGKGKTTAALGQALRAVGEGKRVLMIQFIKGPWKSGEDDVQIKGNPSTGSGSGAFKLLKMGKGFVGILGDTLPHEAHEEAAAEALELAIKEASNGDWDIVILDEVNNALQLNLIPLQDVLMFIDSFPKEKHLILTGRDADEEVISRADIATEMRELKHIYNEGVKGRRGIEY